MMHRISQTAGYLFFVASVAAMTPAMSGQTYKAIAEYKLPGSSVSGITVDSVGRRLFVADGDGIVVLNADTGTSLGRIPLPGATDVLLVPVMNGDEREASTKGFATGDGKVISFSLADMKVQSTNAMPTAGASSLCYDEDTKSVEAVSAGGSIVTIDAGSDRVLRSSLVDTGSGQIACGAMSKVYVADTAANVVRVLNSETGKNDGDLPMMTGHKPSGLTLDTKGRRLFVTCEDGVIEVIDTDSGFTFIQLKAGSGPADATFVWTPQGKGQWKAATFLAQQDGTLTAVRMNAYINYTIGGVYKFSPGLRGIAYDEPTHHLFLTAVHAGAPVVMVAAY